MAYIPGYEHDIFISYAHNDNSEKSKKWVQNFVNELRDIMTRSLGSGLDIWWDEKKIDGLTYFDDKIKRGLDQSAILVCLDSPSYNNSEWCKKELSYFYEKAKNEDVGLKINEHGRIVHLNLFKMDHESWLPEFEGRTGVVFHEESGEDPLKIGSEGFDESLKHLRSGLKQLVINLKNKLKEESATNTVHDYNDNLNENFIVYVGNGPESLRERPKRIIEELKKNGFGVISGVPLEAEEVYATTLKDIYAQVHLSIHFLDEYPGDIIEDNENEWYRKKEVELALEHSPAQLIWMSPNVDFEDEDLEINYKEFLQRINDGEFASEQNELIQGRKANILDGVLGHVSKLQEKLKKKGEQESGYVLLDNHRADLYYKSKLEQDLKNNNIEYDLTPIEDEPIENNEKLKDRIKKSSKLIFVYGYADEKWFNPRLSKAVQLFISNGGSVKDILVYMAPPKKESTNLDVVGNQHLPITIINDSEDSDIKDHLLSEYLKELKTNANG